MYDIKEIFDMRGNYTTLKSGVDIDEVNEFLATKKGIFTVTSEKSILTVKTIGNGKIEMLELK